MECLPEGKSLPLRSLTFMTSDNICHIKSKGVGVGYVWLFKAFNAYGMILPGVGVTVGCFLGYGERFFGVGDVFGGRFGRRGVAVGRALGCGVGLGFTIGIGDGVG